jgi:DNA-binding CsgD family transcriptional regulator
MRLSNLPVFVLVSCISILSARTQITAKIDLDTTKWAPVAYLSHIPDFDQLNTISYEFIIENADISPKGIFTFQTNLLPDEEQLYRIHFSKKGDPSSSLIIGGKDHNHIFLLAKKEAKIQLIFQPGKKLINTLEYKGYQPNNALKYVNSMVNLLDSIDYFGGSLNRDFFRKAIFQQLRDFADTCSFPLVSLYAIYQSNFETDFFQNPAYYKKYHRKWSSQQSSYFKLFRKDLNISPEINPFFFVLIAVAILILIFVLLIIYRRKMNRTKNALIALTIQERKIFQSLKEGKSNKEIADEFAVSLSTVKSHVNNIYSKLGIKSRKEILDFE